MPELHDYQKVAVAFLRGRGRAGLFLDMGLGKTAVSLSALTPEHLPALVVAPKRVAETVWSAERDLWRPDLSIAVAKGDADAREAALAARANVTVISRDNLGDALRVRGRQRFKTLIVDELSGYKNRDTARHKAARQLIRRHRVEYVWGLTGTPSPNGLLDLWAQVFLLDNGRRLGSNVSGYRSRYFVPGKRSQFGHVIEWLPRPESEANILGKIEDICLSMETEGRIELPPVTFNEVRVELPAKVRKVYDEIAAELIVDLKELFGGEVHSAANAAVLTSKLSQISAGFLFGDDRDVLGDRHTKLHSVKLDALTDIIEEQQGSPTLVFYRFIPEMEAIRKRFPKARLIDEDGVIEDWNAGKVPMLLAHPASASHGLNLQHGGHTIVWTSLTWSLEEWEQANKRLLRQGQKHPVVIHMLMADGTVCTMIRKRLIDKANVQNRILDYLESPL